MSHFEQELINTERPYSKDICSLNESVCVCVCVCVCVTRYVIGGALDMLESMHSMLIVPLYLHVQKHRQTYNILNGHVNTLQASIKQSSHTGLGNLENEENF